MYGAGNPAGLPAPIVLCLVGVLDLGVEVSLRRPGTGAASARPSQRPRGADREPGTDERPGDVDPVAR